MNLSLIFLAQRLSFEYLIITKTIYPIRPIILSQKVNVYACKFNQNAAQANELRVPNRTAANKYKIKKIKSS